MTNTALYSGLPEGKSSSRVSRPPGGDSSNIFGTDDPPAPQQRRQEERHAESQQQQAQYQAGDQYNQTGVMTPAQQNTQQRAANNNRDAPFAQFDESEDQPRSSQFNKSKEKSQNEADFRTNSATSYQDAVDQNAATKRRAQGQDNIFQGNRGYDTSHANPQERSEQHRRFVPPPSYGKVTYNTITGEEYPADYGHTKLMHSHKEEHADKSVDSELQTDVTSNGVDTAIPNGTTAPMSSQREQPASQPKSTFTRVHQPPGGTSSGPLW